MIGWTLALSVFGAMTGALGAASGYYSYILSGYRVKIHLTFAISTKDGGHIEFASNWSGDFAEYSELILDSSFLQILIIARNSGRSKIDVRQLVIQNYWKKANEKDERKGHSHFLVSYPPIGGKKMPYCLDFGTSCSWLIPFDEIKNLITDTAQGEGIRNSIFTEIRLADGKSAYSKRRGLTPSQIDSFQGKWEEYRNERF